MQVIITSTRIEIVQRGKVLPLIGADMFSARFDESTVKQPGTGEADLSIFIRLQYQEKEEELPLRSISNQPRWTNDQDGAQQALLDILPVMRSPNMTGSGGIFELTGAVQAGPGSGSVPSTLSPTGVTPGTYNNPVVLVGPDGRIISITSTPPSGGDVNGPGSAGDENIPLFNGTSGKLIKDSGITLAQVVTTDGNPAGVSPIGSGSGVWPIELRRFTDSLAIKAQANTGSVSFGLVFSALNKVFIGDILGDPVEADVATAATANAIVRALGTGKIDTSFLPDSVLGQLEYQGPWDAATNTPAIPAASTGNKGWYYIASTAVASSHGYPNVPAVDFAIGDWLVSNGTSWDKIDNTDAVASVFGRVGAIVAAFGDYSSTLISNLSTVAGSSVTDALNNLLTAIGGKQDADATLTALAGLNSTPGLLEQTGADAFTKRNIGAAAATDILSRGDGDGRYDALGAASAAQSAAIAASVEKSLFDAKGDLITASADDTPFRLQAGTDGAVLHADSTATGGLSYGFTGIHVPHVPPSGNYVIPSVASLALATIGGAANRVDFYPFVPSKTFTIDRLALEVTTFIAASQLKIGIYSNLAGIPDALLLGTGNLDGGSNGVKFEAAAFTFVAGTPYWLAVHFSANTTVRGIAVGGLIQLAYPAAGGTALSTVRRATVTYASGLPNPAPSAALTGATAPVVMLRVA